MSDLQKQDSNKDGILQASELYRMGHAGVISDPHPDMIRSYQLLKAVCENSLSSANLEDITLEISSLLDNVDEINQLFPNGLDFSEAGFGPDNSCRFGPIHDGTKKNGTRR